MWVAIPSFKDLPDLGIEPGSYAYIHIYVCLCISEMNDNYDRRDRGGREELGIFCYYKVFVQPMKWYSVFESCKYILQSVGQPTKKHRGRKA